MSLRLLRAIIRPEKKARVLRRLENEGFSAITATRVYGRGKQRGIQVGSATYDELAKTSLLLAVEESGYERAVQIILEEAHTGQPGDGKIFVQSVAQVLTVRTAKGEL